MIDSHDPDHLARFWCAVLGHVVVFRNDRMVAIAQDRNSHPGLGFIRNNSAKTTKNRVHFDLRPDDQAQEIDRLIGIGAQRVDIGQGNPSWVVMADPEGNEFCVLANWTD